jgi:hypothetical protein
MQKESVLTARAVVAPPAAAKTTTQGYPRRVWDHWRQSAHAIGVVQTRFLMLLIYAIVVVPTGALMRMSRDPLHLRRPASGNNWTAVRPPERNVDSARRQF